MVKASLSLPINHHLIGVFWFTQLICRIRSTVFNICLQSGCFASTLAIFTSKEFWLMLPAAWRLQYLSKQSTLPNFQYLLLERFMSLYTFYGPFFTGWECYYIFFNLRYMASNNSFFSKESFSFLNEQPTVILLCSIGLLKHIYCCSRRIILIQFCWRPFHYFFFFVSSRMEPIPKSPKSWKTTVAIGSPIWKPNFFCIEESTQNGNFIDELLVRIFEH